MKETTFTTFGVTLGVVFGAALSLWIMYGLWIFRPYIHISYDSRPYIQTHRRAYMLISDQPMKIKSVNVVESEGK